MRKPSKSLGVILDGVMRAKNISQTELAKLAAVNQSQISFYLNGERTPNIDTVAAIADALNLSVDTLLGREKKPSETQAESLEKKLRIVRALFFAERHELDGIVAACAPVERRLLSLKKNESTA